MNKRTTAAAAVLKSVDYSFGYEAGQAAASRELRATLAERAAPIDWDLSLERLDEDAADGLRHVARAIIERLRSQGRIEATR